MFIFTIIQKHFLQDSMSLVGCWINSIDVNFHLQKSLETFDENLADKIWTKKNKEIKISYLMPIMFKKVLASWIDNIPNFLYFL